MVQITPLPLPASSFNFSSKEKGFTFFGLKNFLVTGSYGALWFHFSKQAVKRLLVMHCVLFHIQHKT